MSKNFDSPIEIHFCGAMPDEARFTVEPARGRKIVGGPVQNHDANYVAHCPWCDSVLDDDDHGYGLAYGGGIGHYIVCSNKDCHWFIKEIEEDVVHA